MDIHHNKKKEKKSTNAKKYKEHEKKCNFSL